MTEAERFRRAFDFQPLDRPPRMETPAFWPQTIEEWRAAGGLPAGADPFEHYGICPLRHLPGNTGWTQIPFTTPYEPALLAVDGPIEVRRDSQGRVYRTFADGSSMPQWLRFPVETPEGWERDVRGRIEPGRHDYGDLERAAAACRSNPEPNDLFLCGLYAFWRNLWGVEKLAYAFYDHPETLREQAGAWLEFNTAVSERVLALCRCDFVLLHEDMAFKTGPLIGPGLFRRFMLPWYGRLIDRLRALGQTRFMVDSDGNNLAILPLFIEAGIGGLYSFEVAAGNDIVQVRRGWPDFFIWGGLDKRALLKDTGAIHAEIVPKVRRVWETGGYLPALDHATPPCPQANWECFLKALRAQFPG